MHGTVSVGAGKSIGFRRIPVEITVAICLVLALQVAMVLTKAINWDEFWYYSQISQFAAGSLNDPLQTFHVRLFGWLRLLPGSGIDHIIVARMVMLCCALVSAVAIMGVARRFTPDRTAALAALTYLTGGFAFQHDFAFRTDPMTAALLMTALWAMLCRVWNGRTIVAVAFLLAIATMLTIKVVLYVPAFAGVVWLRWTEAPDRRQFIARLAAIGAIGSAAFAALFAWHQAGLASGAIGDARAVLATSSQKMFSSGIIPHPDVLLKQLAIAPFLTAMIVLFPLTWLRSPRPAAECVALAGLILPLATTLFYRNSHPYYYGFILPPVAAALAISIELLRQRFGMVLLGSSLIANAAVLSAIEPRDVLPRQRALLAATKQIFPRPVAYFDSCAMLGDYPRPIIFLTQWGLELYREAGQPQFVEAMARQPVPLLVANHRALRAALAGRSIAEGLLPRDAAVLHDNFIPHWGPLWVAGKRFARGGEAQPFVIAVPGLYTVEGFPLQIDGTSAPVGAVITLARGRHIVGVRSGLATLRWGDHLPVPTQPVPSGSLFTDF